MNIRWSGAVSSLHQHRNVGLRLAIVLRTPNASRYYSAPHSSPHADLKRPEKAALVQINGSRQFDPIEPPESTRPPPLKLPERGDKNIAAYYYRIGRAYGSFYWVGIKAVWFNWKAAKALKERVKKQIQADGGDIGKQPAWLARLSRSEFQLLERNNYDIGKLPFFGLLVCLFGEWLPVLVPFIPSTVPGTCRIPKQIQGMRAKSEERRRVSFRQGISEPAIEQLPVHVPEHLTQSKWPMVQREYAHLVLNQLRDDQIYHLSCTLNNHNRLWDRVQLPPPAALLRRGLSRKLAYITSDDMLLNQHSGSSRLSAEEIAIACEERGLDVLGKREDTLRQELSWWLARQRDDLGRGSALFTMLFRRPNAWETVVSKKR